MHDCNPFDMELDGEVHSIDFLGFGHLIRRALRTHRDEPEGQEDDDSREDEMSDDPYG